MAYCITCKCDDSECQCATLVLDGCTFTVDPNAPDAPTGVDPQAWTCAACGRTHGGGTDVCPCAGEALRLRARPGLRLEVHTYDAERVPTATSTAMDSAPDTQPAPPADPFTQVMEDLARTHPDVAERLAKPRDERLVASAVVQERTPMRMYEVRVAVHGPESETPLVARAFTQSIGGGVRAGALPRVLRRMAENAMEQVRVDLGVERRDWHAVSIELPGGDVVQPEPIE